LNNEKNKLKEESIQSYIDTERDFVAREMNPHGVQLSQLIREHYIKENQRHNKSLEVDVSKKPIEAKDNSYSNNYDPLVGLINRECKSEQLEEFLQLAKKENKILVIFLLVLNSFKQLSDIYGQAISNEALIIVAKRLESIVSKDDYISWVGRNKYLVSFLTEKEKLSKVETIAENITTLISKPMDINGFRINLDTNVEIVAYPIHGNQVSVLLDIADKKMYQAEQCHKNLS
jgi:diguanylate cyclase (GGDEF)-like protein